MRSIIMFIIGLLSFILLGLGIYGYTLSKNRVVVIEDNNKYVGYYGIENKVKRYSTKDENIFYDMLYIRNDGTYYLSINNYLFEDISVGTYTYDEDSIKLNETVRYKNNDCFYKSSNVYEVKVSNDVLSFKYNDKEYSFEKNIGINETITNRSYYASSPVNGEFPDGWGEEWKECSVDAK